MSSFYNSLSQVTPNPQANNPHAVPTPSEMSTAYRLLADSMLAIRADTENMDEDSLLAELVSSLNASALVPPKAPKGVDEAYIAKLERVPLSSLKKLASQGKDSCPICTRPFLEDEHPLVVRLPCHESHVFDLECVEPWMRMEGTCPMDRKDLAKEERNRKAAWEERLRKEREEDGEEDDMDGVYA